jgi:hypothetical protein
MPHVVLRRVSLPVTRKEVEEGRFLFTGAVEGGKWMDSGIGGILVEAKGGYGCGGDGNGARNDKLGVAGGAFFWNTKGEGLGV